MPRLAARLALAAALTATASTASAQTRTWNIVTNTAGACTAGAMNGVPNAYYSCTSAAGASAVGLTVAGFSAAGSAAGSAVTSGVLTNQGSNGVGVGAAGENYGSAQSGNGDHAVDNANGNGFDLLYLGFASSQALTSVRFGWTGLDADFQVLRWTGASAPVLTAATTVGSLIAPGAWQLVTTVDGRTSNAGNDTDVTYAVNAGGASSAHWLISAYNPGLGGTQLGNTTADAFKVNAVTATQAAVVPEPSTYALMATGLAGLLAAARRRRTA